MPEFTHIGPSWAAASRVTPRPPAVELGATTLPSRSRMWAPGAWVGRWGQRLKGRGAGRGGAKLCPPRPPYLRLLAPQTMVEDGSRMVGVGAWEEAGGTFWGRKVLYLGWSWQGSI